MDGDFQNMKKAVHIGLQEQSKLPFSDDVRSYWTSVTSVWRSRNIILKNYIICVLHALVGFIKNKNKSLLLFKLLHFTSLY
jgi:hypothetical protein